MVRAHAAERMQGGESAVRIVAFWELAAAMLLGFAGATFFFLLPEVLVTFVAMQKRRLRAALIISLAAATGAVLGGWMMYSWGAGASARVVTAFMDALPGVSREMVGEAFNALRLQGAAALFGAPLQGAPYKVYAAVAAQAGVPIGAFLLYSAAAFLLRFLSGGVTAYLLAVLWRRLFPALSPAWLWGAAWLGIYGLWFVSLPE